MPPVHSKLLRPLGAAAPLLLPGSTSNGSDAPTNASSSSSAPAPRYAHCPETCEQSAPPGGACSSSAPCPAAPADHSVDASPRLRSLLQRQRLMAPTPDFFTKDFLVRKSGVACAVAAAAQQENEVPRRRSTSPRSPLTTNPGVHCATRSRAVARTSYDGPGTVAEFKKTYEITKGRIKGVEDLGEGAFGSVLRCEHKLSKAKRAVKIGGAEDKVGESGKSAEYAKKEYGIGEGKIMIIVQFPCESDIQ